MREHVLTDRLTFSGVCRAGRFHCPVIRVYNIVGKSNRSRKTAPFYIEKYIIIWA